MKYFDSLLTKNNEYKPYKLWKLSKNYLNDINQMLNDMKHLNVKSLKDKNFFLKNKLKFMNWKTRRYYYKRRIYFELSKKYRSKIRRYPIKIRRMVGYKIWRTFLRTKNYLKIKKYRIVSKKRRKFRRFKKNFYITSDFDVLKNKEMLKDRFSVDWKKWIKALNSHSWSSRYKDIFLKKRDYWEKNIRPGYKFYNTYAFKLLHHYLTVIFYKCFGLEWFSLFSKFLYERQRRLFMPKNWRNILDPNSTRVTLWKNWQGIINKYKTLPMRVKKYLSFMNYRGYFRNKLRRKKYWRKRISKLKFAYPKRKKKKFLFSKRRIAFRRYVKRKKINKSRNFLAMFKSVYFTLYQSFYALFFKKKISLDLGFLFSFKCNFNVYFFINNKKKLILNSKILFYYIKKRIFRGASFIHLLKYVMKKLKKLYKSFKIDGFAIVLNGRFSKKDRATQHWFKHGKFTKSTRISKIDHFRGEMFLKYSLCSLKVSIMRNNYRHRLKKKKEKLKKIKNINKLNAILS